MHNLKRYSKDLNWTKKKKYLTKSGVFDLNFLNFHLYYKNYNTSMIEVSSNAYIIEMEIS